MKDYDFYHVPYCNIRPGDLLLVSLYDRNYKRTVRLGQPVHSKERCIILVLYPAETYENNGALYMSTFCCLFNGLVYDNLFYLGPKYKFDLPSVVVYRNYLDLPVQHFKFNLKANRK